MFKRIISLTVSAGLLLQQTVFAYTASLNLSNYLSQASNPIVSDRFRPISLRYFSYQPLTNDFNILLDKGDFAKGLSPQGTVPDQERLKETAQELMRYFLIGVTLPNDKFWVNLRPDSEDQIIDDELARTDLGKVMLEADLKLKQDTALFTSPQTPQGKAYWDKLYQRAGELFGTENITIPTLTRPWIVPGEIILRESADKDNQASGAYIYKATLKVMLEEDYLKSNQKPVIRNQIYSFSDPRLKELNEYSTQLIKELILPKLTQKVNSSQDYAKLRQVYFSLILARWFKEKYKGETRNQSTETRENSYIKLIDSRNLTNLSSKQAWDKTTYFQAYQKSFKEGEYNLSEPVYTLGGQVLRRYMSGGLSLDNFNIHNNPVGGKIGLYTATEGDIGNSPIVAGDRNVILNIGPNNKLNIQDPTAAVISSGSPVNAIMDEPLQIMRQLSKKTPSKIFYLVIDGLGGMPTAGKTELEKAIHPNLDELSQKASVGSVNILGIPGITPGSGPGHFAIFGYNPYGSIGRGVLDALGADVKLEPGDIVARGNFSTLSNEGIITDRRAGRIETKDAEKIIQERLSGIEIEGVKFLFYSTKDHRMALVIRGKDLSSQITDSDPGKDGLAPHSYKIKTEQQNEGAERLARLMNKLTGQINERLHGNIINPAANTVLFRGFDSLQEFPGLKSIYKVTPAAICTYPAYKGIAKILGMDVLLVSGQTLQNQVDALKSNLNNYDFFYFHVKQTDSAGEDGNFDAKVKKIEEVDAMLPQILKMMNLDNGDTLVVTSDHSTPAQMKVHTWHDVPVLIYSKNSSLEEKVKRFTERQVVQGYLGKKKGRDIMGLAMAEAGKSEKLDGPIIFSAGSPLTREPSQYGPHPSQEGLRPFYERIAWARKYAPDAYKIKKIYAFFDQKHGVEPTEAISFGVVLEGDKDEGEIVINQNAPVMGGISAGKAEPGTHPSIKEAIDFFNKNVSSKLIGLNISQPDTITDKIIEIDEEFRNSAENKEKPRFSYIGAELSVGISMISTIALAEALNVPAEVVINYRYNEYALANGLAKELRPMSIPVNLSVVWEGGKHGAAKYLPELVAQGVIKDISRFPKRFLDEKLIQKKDKSILLAMVPPQELQIMVFAPEWDDAREIGIKLTKIYQKLLLENGIKTKSGAESGFTTEQLRDKDGKLITLELVLDILERAVSFLPQEEARYVRYALDIAASEMYISEIDMYYIGPEAAGNKDGLVTNQEFTRYKLELFKKYWRFISVEDWADENKIEHWEDAKQIIPKMIQMGDDFDVSRADLIEKYTRMGLQNAHLQKPNQSSEEKVGIEAVATSHYLGNVVVTSHRGTRPAQEVYSAEFAIGAGTFGAKWTLWGLGRGPLIAAMTQADTLYNKGLWSGKVKVSYQGALVLDPQGPYKDVGWVKRLREELAASSAIVQAPENPSTDGAPVRASSSVQEKVTELKKEIVKKFGGHVFNADNKAFISANTIPAVKAFLQSRLEELTRELEDENRRYVVYSNDLSDARRRNSDNIGYIIGKGTELSESDRKLKDDLLRTGQGIEEKIQQKGGSYLKQLEKVIQLLSDFIDNIPKDASSAIMTKETATNHTIVGGIDLRQMNMLIQPQGSFASSILDFSLPMLSRAELESFDLDQELTALQRMASSGMDPNPERFKAALAVCFALGRTGRDIDRLKSCLEDVFEHQQFEAREASNGYKEVLVVADTRSYVLKEGRFAAGK